jgi:hypothetical protein
VEQGIILKKATGLNRETASRGSCKLQFPIPKVSASIAINSPLTWLPGPTTEDLDSRCPQSERKAEVKNSRGGRG